MLRPTYNDLIGSLNNGAEDGAHEVESRFSVVIASAKRARQIIDGDESLLPNEEGKKPLSIAIDEIYKGAVTIEQGSEEDDEPIAVKIEKEDFSRYVSEDGEEDDDIEEDSSDLGGSSEDNYESDSEA